MANQIELLSPDDPFVVDLAEFLNKQREERIKILKTQRIIIEIK